MDLLWSVGNKQLDSPNGQDFLKKLFMIAREDLTRVQQKLIIDPTNQISLQREDIQRNHYIAVMILVPSLVKQQSKADWIKFGDDYSRLATCIYTLQDNSGTQVEAFEEVAKVMSSFYSKLLGKKMIMRNNVNPEHKLPTKATLQRFNNIIIMTDSKYALCQSANEDEDHMVFDCSAAKEVSVKVLNWWKMKINLHSSKECILSLLKLKGSAKKCHL
ncbi:hypothetical protein Cgig2_004415 [Carnegiea gigantea]|uniref:Uncharacterized protein n=1 Tax=Carnegiea gigantea TaxID=171969 RepID=A0A9Q1GGB7_9CARY|nr:hypothetical protein Cgig2_004415 [Carnegiea gigantea]